MLNNPWDDTSEEHSMPCVPTALCAITGLPRSIVEGKIKEHSLSEDGKPLEKVEGVSPLVYSFVLRRLGWEIFRDIDVLWKDYDLADIVRLNFADFPLLLTTHGKEHVIACYGQSLCDTHTRFPIQIEHALTKIPSNLHIIQHISVLRKVEDNGQGRKTNSGELSRT